MGGALFILYWQGATGATHLFLCATATIRPSYNLRATCQPSIDATTQTKPSITADVELNPC